MARALDGSEIGAREQLIVFSPMSHCPLTVAALRHCAVRDWMYSIILTSGICHMSH